MKKTRHITAFYLEALLLVGVLVAVVLILTRCFALAHTARQAAEELNNGTILAKNAAEAVECAADAVELARILNENGNASAEGDIVTVYYDTDMTPNAGGQIRLTAVPAPQQYGAGELVYYTITVENVALQKTIYTLETAAWRKGGAD